MEKLAITVALFKTILNSEYLDECSGKKKTTAVFEKNYRDMGNLKQSPVELTRYGMF